MAVFSVVEYNKVQRQQRWDAEAFTPILLQIDAQFAHALHLSLLATVIHPAEIPRVYCDADHGKPFLLAQNIRPILLDTLKKFYIQDTVAEGLPINRLQKGDVLVTRSGAFSGVSAIYLGKNGECYTSGEGVIVRSHGDIDGAYLVVFFNTTRGLALCQRAIYGSGQPHISPKYLELTLIPRLGRIEEVVASLVHDAYQLTEDAKSYYPEAEAELLDRLDWDHVASVPLELCYSADFTNLNATGRYDAEFFHPHFARLRSQISRRDGMRLGTICAPIKRGVQPQFTEEGDVLVLDSKAIRPQGVAPAQADRTSREFYDHTNVANARVSLDDVLLNSTGRGTLGRAACYQWEELAICDNHVAILRPNHKLCLPIYLALFLNSPAGLAQSEQCQTGSSGQIELYPQHIAQYEIFIPRNSDGSVDLRWQEYLAAKIAKASEANTRAQQKLQEAISLVEQAIR